MAQTYQEQVQETLKTLSSTTGKKQGSIPFMALGDKPTHMPRISSGIPELDSKIGGGIPLGRILEVYGPESGGKTTIATVMLGAAQRAGLIAAAVDAEHTFDRAWASKNGVDVDNLIFVQPDSAEEATEAVIRLFENGVDFVVLDSVAALTPQAEIDGEMADNHVGLQARLMGQFMRKVNGVMKEDQVLICINQLREKVGVMFGNPETTPGGRALKFYASIRLRVGGSKTDTGRDLKVKTEKNKTAPPFQTAEFKILFEHGVDFLSSAAAVGIVEKGGGGYFTLPFQDEEGNDVRVRGFDKTYEWLVENDKAQELRDMLDAVMLETSTEED